MLQISGKLFAELLARVSRLLQIWRYNSVRTCHRGI